MARSAYSSLVKGMPRPCSGSRKWVSWQDKLHRQNRRGAITNAETDLLSKIARTKRSKCRR